MPGMSLKQIVDHAMYLKRDLDPIFTRDNAIQAYEDLWRSHPWRFRRVFTSLLAVADYSTGNISAWTQGANAVTGDSTVWGPEFVQRHIRPEGSGRDYLIYSRSGDTAIVTEDPWEGTSISSNTAYTAYQKWYRLPPDFGQLFVAKESGGPQIVRHIDRVEFEEAITSADDGGGTFWLIDAGTSKTSLYSTGTVTMTEGSTTITGSGTAFLSARDKGRRFRVRGMTKYGDFTISSVTNGTEVIADRAWRGPTKSGLAYDIDPAGEPLVELYPRPSSNTSIGLWYYKTLPPLALDTESPQGLPLEYHDAWLYGTLARLGIVDPGQYQSRLGQLMTKQGLMSHQVRRTLPYGSKTDVRRSLLPADYPEYFPGR